VAGSALVVIILAVGFSLARPWLTSWGATDEELEGTFPGDELVPQPFYQHTQAITIDAPAVEVWTWVVQLGQDRGGFYTYDWLENLFSCDIHNADRIVPEWQHREVGNFVSVCKGVGGWWIEALQPERFIVFRDKAGSAPVALVLQPEGNQTSRLIARMRLGGEPNLMERIMVLDFWWTHAPVKRRMLADQRSAGIRTRAEGATDSPSAMALEVVAWLGALGLGLVAAALILVRGDWKRPLGVRVAALAVLLAQTFLQPPIWARFAMDPGLLLGIWWAAR
jgi:hypothetical protein